MGTWDQSAKVDDIEAYLLTAQRKFVKYRLNIFFLNKVSLPSMLELTIIFVQCALKIQHFFYKAKERRMKHQENQIRESNM